MVATALQANLSGLARALVSQRRLLEADAETLQGAAATAHVGFVTQLIQSGKMTSIEVAEFASRTFGLPLLDLNAVDFDQVPSDVLDRKLVESRRVVALHRRGNRLILAVSDPSQLQALEEVQFQTGLVVDPVIVEDEKLAAAVLKLMESTESRLKSLITEDVDLQFAEEEAQAEEETKAPEVDDAPVVKFIQKVMLDAINLGASDIHFEPYEKFYRVRYRVDGVLFESAQPPHTLKERIASRIKVISRLDIAEKRVPQDGRMKLMLAKNRAIDFRVSTLPTLFGEKIVLRILDSSGAKLSLDQLGYEPDQLGHLLHAINRPYGMILVTGPTGSGKTVSLYSCINLLNKPGVNIATAEDPAEIMLSGVNQVNIHEKAGLTFAAALKAFLRQDPDIIMVGEVRDTETAEIAIKAAQTGHLVLATVHTNDAPTTLTRLVNMGIAPFNVASSVILITAQRLARRLCSCKKPENIPVEALLRAGFAEEDLDGTWQPYGPGGCDLCKRKGYKGRLGIYQVMPVSEEMQRIIMTNGNSIDIAEQASREGVRDLRQSGLLKVRQGLTSLEEVEAVTNE
ncbi:MAG TPA: type IV-A pilus assembly ATPase PilB [Burkholderiales bacterium]|nr:type IV-A pilus assembly ATPase PilB [Burkholderiales bacterium]